MLFVFDEFELDTRRFELRRAGEVRPTEPQVFDVLRYLVEHRDRVVSKIELLDNIWGDRFVSESALTSRIKAARRLVGDDGKSQRVIKTAHGRGYRFAVPVTEQIEASPVERGGGPLAEAPAADDRRAPRVDDSDDGRWPLLGRGGELERVAALFADPAAGGVLLIGGAGIGKTRLAEEVLSVAAAADIPTARAAAHPEAQAIPLAAFAHLLPLADLGVSGDTDLDRAALFHRARAALAGDTRRILHVDDVDQLDELSRALLGSLIADRTVFAVLTMRARPEPVPTIEHLVKDGHIGKLVLEPLDREIVETLLHRALGGPVVGETTRQFADASLGNPGIVRQLVESSIAAGTLGAVHGVWALQGPLRVPPSLASLVAERLTGLDGDLRGAVELLAIAGQLGVELLIELTAESALEELERRGVVRLRADGRRHDAALAHPLYGEVVRGEMPTLRVRRLKRRLADAITATGARRREDRIRVVAWQLDTGGAVAPEMVLQTATLAFLGYDLDTAEALLARLPEPDGSPAVVQLRAELAFRRGRAGDVEQLLASIDLGPLDDAHRAQIIRRRATNLFFDTADYRDAVDVLGAELRRVRDPDVRQSLEAHLSMLLVHGGQIAMAMERAAEALPEATGVARLQLLRALGLALVHAARPLEGLELAREGQMLRQELDDDPALPGVTLLLFVEVAALTAAARIDDARAAAQRLKADYPAAQLNWIDLALGRLELFAGRPVAARRALAAVVHDARARQHGPIERWALAIHACAHLIEGRADLARAELDRVAALEVGGRALYHPEIDRSHAWLAAANGNLDAARTRLLESAADCERRGQLAMVSALLHDVARFGAPGLVAGRLEEVAAASDGDLFVARALHTAGLVADDPDRIASAVELFARGGCRLYAAEAAAAQAALLRRVGSYDAAEAAEMRATELGRSDGIRLVSPALP